MVEQCWCNSEVEQCWWNGNGGTVKVEQRSGTVEQWNSVGGTVVLEQCNSVGGTLIVEK